MKNPQLNHVVVELEIPIWTLNHVWADDRKAGKTDYEPTDSTVKSAIRRLMGHLKGRPPKPLVLKKKETVDRQPDQKYLADLSKTRNSVYQKG